MWALMTGFICLWYIWRRVYGPKSTKGLLSTAQPHQVLLSTPVTQPTGLNDFPMELLVEIAAHLDVPGLISFRKTNRRFFTATNNRRIWYALAKDYCNRYSNIPCPGNENIENMTTEELREWVEPRLLVDEIWRTPNAYIPRKRSFIKPRTACSWSILPGGRWFLSCHKTGVIDYYDLDSNCLIPITLYCPKERNVIEKQFYDSTAFWCDRAPFQGFLISTPCIPDILGGGRLFIRQITCVGKGKSRSLNLQTVACIPEISWEPVTHGVGINDEIAIRHSSYTSKRCPWIEVFRWRHCSKRWVNISVIPIPRVHPQPLLYPVAEDRVLCACEKGFSLYRIPPFRRVKWEPRCDLLPYQWNTPLSKPIWKYDGAFTINWVDPPAFKFDGSCYRLVFRTQDDIVGVIIPASIDESPYVQFRFSHNLKRPISVGIFKSISVYEDLVPLRFSHGWRGEDNTIQGENVRLRGGYYWFDEESGRSITLENSTTFLVLDLIPYASG